MVRLTLSPRVMHQSVLSGDEPLLRRALAIDEASYRDVPPAVAICLNNLGCLLGPLGRAAAGGEVGVTDAFFCPRVIPACGAVIQSAPPVFPGFQPISAFWGFRRGAFSDSLPPRRE
jgi:hypothetical protein